MIRKKGISSFTTILGIILTEIRVMGIPIRTPLIALGGFLIQGPLFSFLVLILAIAYFLSSPVDLDFAKSNALTFLVISTGAIVCAKSRTWLSEAPIKFSLLFLLVLSILQVLGISPLESLFVLDPAFYRGRPTALSSEPSFAVWMIFYLVLIRYTRFGRFGKLGWSSLLVHLFWGATFTVILVLIVFAASLAYSRVVTKSRFLLGLFFVLLSIAVPLCIDIYMRLNGLGLGEFSLIQFRSWRELSHFSSVLGANWISFPKFGDYSSLMWEGQEWGNRPIYEWISFPWSLFGLWSLEFGRLASFIFLTVVWSLYYRPVNSKLEFATMLTFFVIAWVFGPKWIVYMLIFPLREK